MGIERYMTVNEFKEKTGYFPMHDDLQRVNCREVGKVGHFMCGWCPDHDKPRFDCGCINKMRAKL